MRYDRLQNRAMDNSKILRDAGLTKSDLTPVKKALEIELSGLARDYRFPNAWGWNERFDAYLKRNGLI